MNIVMFGPPGAGKGSVSEKITLDLNIPHISTGDIVRAESKKENNRVSAFMEKGELVPDQLIMELVSERLGQDDCKNGFILDGFPRTIPQAEFLEQQNIKVGIVVNLCLGDDIIVKRLSGRRMDPSTGKIYNINTMAIPEDVDQSQLVQRPDDKEEVIKQRLEVYTNQTQPLIEYYQQKGLMKDVNANRPLSEVINDVLSLVKEHGE